MTRHLTADELQGFQQNTPNPQQLLRADRHLAECSECQRKLRMLGAVPVLPEVLQQSPDELLHPEYEQLTAYIDGTQNATDREWMTDHLSACRSCKKELDDLRGFDTVLLQEETQRQIAAQPKPGAFAKWVARIQQWFAIPGNAGYALSSMALLIVGVAVMAHVEMLHPEQMAGHVAIDDLTRVSPDNAIQFYAGLAIAALGLAGIIHRLRK